MELVQEHTSVKVMFRTVVCFPMGRSFFHWHENCEICMPINTAAKFVVDGELISAEPGDIIVADEYEPHQFIVEMPDTNIRIIHIGFDCFVSRTVPLMPLKKHIKREEIEAIPGLSQYIEFFFSTAEKEKCICNDAGENPVLAAMTEAFYYMLMRHFVRISDSSKNKSMRSEFYKIAEYINANYKDDVTVNSISDKLFISRKKATSIFRRFSGMGIGDYVNMLRVKNVNYLLSRGVEISEAAFESGFQSLRTFNAVYKKQTGITPTEYLRGNAQKE